MLAKSWVPRGCSAGRLVTLHPRLQCRDPNGAHTTVNAPFRALLRTKEKHTSGEGHFIPALSRGDQLSADTSANSSTSCAPRPGRHSEGDDPDGASSADPDRAHSVPRRPAEVGAGRSRFLIVVLQDSLRQVSARVHRGAG